MKRQSGLAATGNRRAFLSLALLALGSAMLFTDAAQAQSSYRASYRDSYRKSIVVDDSVLNALGPAPNLIDILNPSQTSSGLAPYPAIARRAEVRQADLPPPPAELRSRLVAIPRASGAVRVTPMASIPNHAGLNNASRVPPPPSSPLPIDLDAPYHPPVAGDSPPPVSRPANKPAAVDNSGTAARSSTLTALAVAETLPLPQKTQLAPPPPPSPASPPSAYRPSITAPAPAPEPVPAPASTAPPMPLAALASPAPASAPAIERAENKRLLFTSGNAELTLDMQQELDRLAAQLQSNDRIRLRLTAYAEGTVETASMARRLSLRRALAVRSYLGDKGIVGTRVLVEAQGNQSQGGPADRVDIQMVSGS